MSYNDDIESQPVDGLVIMALRIRDEERRQQAIHRLLDLLADRVAPTLFEFNTADWDNEMWNEEIEWMTVLLEGTRDAIIVWRFSGSRFTRFTIGDGE